MKFSSLSCSSEWGAESAKPGSGIESGVRVPTATFVERIRLK
jgi:hypothetical protein